MKLIKNKSMLFLSLFIILFGFGALVYLTVNSKDEVELKQKLSVLERKTIKDIKMGGASLTVEVANSRHKKIRGLMFRKELPQNEGMLFLFGIEGYYNFWTKYTMLPLDIIWVNKDMEIVGVDSGLAPCVQEPCPSYSPPAPVKYVIEVNSGWASRNGVNVGDKVEIPEEARDELQELEEEPEGNIPFFN